MQIGNIYGVRREAKRNAAFGLLPRARPTGSGARMEKRCRRFALPPHSKCVLSAVKPRRTLEPCVRNLHRGRTRPCIGSVRPALTLSHRRRIKRRICPMNSMCPRNGKPCGSATGNEAPRRFRTATPRGSRDPALAWKRGVAASLCHRTPNE